ncbi:MAG: 30S ribosomal protein S16, partial [Acidobacteria bacterium]
MGSRHQPFYRLVVSDGRHTPTGPALEEIGYYNPRSSPAMLKVDLERVDHWLSRGAQPSDTVRQLVRRARVAQNPFPPPWAARRQEQTEEAAEAKDDAEAKAKDDAEAKAKDDAEAKAKDDAEAKAKDDAEAKAKD